MAKHRSHSIEFKRQVAQEFIAGETLHAVSSRHDVSRNLIRIWVRKFEAGAFDDDAQAADLLQRYEAKIAALERMVGRQALTPAPSDPINFEQTVEATIIDWRKRFVLRAIRYDPYQMQASAQRLAKAGMPIEEYPQSVPNLTAATSNLFDLIQSRSIALYSDAAMRLAVSRAIIVESSRAGVSTS